MEQMKMMNTSDLTRNDFVRALEAADADAAAELFENMDALERAIEGTLATLDNGGTAAAEVIARTDLEELDYLRFLITELMEAVENHAQVN
jgi:hypothetical protein